MRVLYSAILLGTFATQSPAASALFDDFDAGVGAWQPNTTETNTSWVGAGGNPDGFRTTNNFGAGISFGIAGAKAEGCAYSGTLPDGIWTASVDLLFYNTPFDDAQLRWRYKDASYNGCIYRLKKRSSI